MRSLLAAVALAAPAAAADWAVLVAGSAGFSNYRHQADVCHAYQILSKGGIPASNIITMMVDDIANNAENRYYPGKIFNKPTPTGEQGVDVYAGVKIDYRGSAVTPENFVNVLTGNAGNATGGNGRVLQSGPNDRVFVNFVDHGGVGLIGFPKTTMHASVLVSALKTMHGKNMYKELVFYLEACESGSMFTNLPKGMNIYATTAANAKESSWGTYCGTTAKVDGKDIGSCLGDLYSVNWMENADAQDLTHETLQSQYEAVKQLTNKSHVLQFGDLSIAAEEASVFEGSGKVGPPSPPSPPTPPTPPAPSKCGACTHCLKKSGACKHGKRVSDKADCEAHHGTWCGGTPYGDREIGQDAGSVDSRDIGVTTLFHNYLSSDADARPAAAAALLKEMREREQADATFRAIATEAGLPSALTSDPRLAAETEGCHKAAVDETQRLCGWTDYSLKYSRVLANLCDVRQEADVLRAVRAHCGN